MSITLRWWRVYSWIWYRSPPNPMSLLPGMTSPVALPPRRRLFMLYPPLTRTLIMPVAGGSIPLLSMIGMIMRDG